MNNRRLTLRNTALASIGIYVEYFLGMVAAILIARHLGPASYGIYSLFIWFAAIGIVLTNSGITTGVIKFIAEFRGAERPELIWPLLRQMRTAQTWHMALVVIVGSILLLLARPHWIDAPGAGEFALLMFGVVMRGPYMFNVAVAKGFEAFDATARISVFAAPVNLALVIAAILLKGTVLWFLIVYATSSALFLLASHLQVRRLLAGLPAAASLSLEQKQRIRRHLRIVSVTIVVNFFIASDVEILFLNLDATSAAAGFFKVAYQLATGMVLLVPGVFGAVLLPMMSKALSQSRELAGRRFAAVTTYLLLLCAPVAVFGICFAGPVIELLYGHAYAEAAPVFALIILACAISTTNQGAVSLLVSADRQQTVLLMTVIFGVLKLSLDASLIHRFGLHGAVAAVLTVSILSSTAYIGAGIRVGRVSMEWRRLFAILVASLLTATIALPVLLLHLPTLLTVFLGGLVVALVFAVATLCLPCWSAADIEQLQELHARFARSRPRPLSRLLRHAGNRAEKWS
jgi:O-antigen/teichoic acid export membrane protein